MAFKFQGVDFIGFDSLLSEDERLVRDTARHLSRITSSPSLRNAIAKAAFPKSWSGPWARLASMAPPSTATDAPASAMSNTDWSCRKWSAATPACAVSSACSRRWSCIQSRPSAPTSKKLAAKLATGEKIGCFALTEPDFGSNPGGMRTRAQKDGDDYILNGEKMWVTSGTSPTSPYLGQGG